MNALIEELTDDEDFLQLSNGFLHPRRPQTFRNTPSHFEIWSDIEFKCRFRLEKRTVRFLIDQVSEKITFRVNKNYALTAEMKVFVTLRYLSTGSILQVTSDFNGIDKSTARRVVRQVTRTIARLSRTYIKFPETQEDIDHTRQGFFNISKFPKCIGALDYTHVRIQSPGGPEAENFRNRKGFFSFNVQAMCDAELKINNLVCRWPGSAHDSDIFRNCNLRTKFENGDHEDSLLVGESGYAIKTYLITPLRHPHTPAEQLIKESQIRTRNPIERCFGVWRRRFPILALGIRLRVEKVESIVVASAVLHKIACIMKDAKLPVNEEIEAVINFVNNVNDVNMRQNDGVNNSVRYALIHNYFANLLYNK